MALQFQKKDPRITITTRFGEIKIRLYSDAAPRHVENLINLVKIGFYNGTTFHRVVPGFIIQGGDPLSKHPER
ncbi:MAG: peptidylprolyl isomerase, partial [Nitrospira sp.]|nr:peptidylprolyl isomerase [Nitrospira sp.]